ncbi:MAG: 30S ribosome-binding factor RbfA [Oligoflexales bacterium]|nr:30S ribosome-binding factor RbfA [Oligoflexales bacterium]
MGLRQVRLADEMRDVLASCFMAHRLEDPRLENIVITHVKLSADLQLASVYFRVMGREDKEVAEQMASISQGFESCKGFLKKALSARIKLRRIPNLRFFYDESIETGARVESILQNFPSK